MAYLGNSARTKEILAKYNMSAKKKFGQNFLIDSNVLNGIVEAAGVTKDDCVLEIGPGIGSLTQCLAEAAGKVVAVEIDRGLIPVLADTLSEYDNVTVINEDILKVDIDEIVAGSNGGRPIKVVANLPYYITTPIIMKLFEKGAMIESITVMVQKEVAERMCAGPGSKDYGAFTLLVQWYTEPELLFPVPPHCFVPQPRVTSAVVRLKRREAPPAAVESEETFFRTVRGAFAQRRKTLSNALMAAFPGLDRAGAEECAAEAGLSPAVRGEALSILQFADLSNAIFRKFDK
jgi:16S rRNA (adenine1518-N6/adenine1519-N6)-dimethyltransferase